MALPAGADTMKKTRHDWSRADAMTDAEIHAAALADPDAQPLTPARLAKMRRTPQRRRQDLVVP
jgi:putative transcriptional regulator